MPASMVCTFLRRAVVLTRDTIRAIYPLRIYESSECQESPGTHTAHPSRLPYPACAGGRAQAWLRHHEAGGGRQRRFSADGAGHSVWLAATYVSGRSGGGARGTG